MLYNDNDLIMMLVFLLVFYIGTFFVLNLNTNKILILFWTNRQHFYFEFFKFFEYLWVKTKLITINI